VSLLLDGLRAIGAEGNLFIAGVLVVAGFYLLRGKRYAGTAAAAAGTATGYTLALLVALAVSIGLGWIEPNPGLIADGIDAVAGPVAELLATAFEMAIESVVGGSS